jgi:hypothetical protein
MTGPLEGHPQAQQVEMVSDEMINSRPGESGSDNFLGVSTGENDLQVRSNVLRFFKDLSAWIPGRVTSSRTTSMLSERSLPAG